MRIGFDLRPFLREETGVGVYFRNLLFQLARIDADNEYFLFSSSLKDRLPDAKVPPFARMRLRDLRIPVKVMNFFWSRFVWPPLDSFFRVKLDLTHSPTPLLLPGRGKKVVTVCDLFFLDFPKKADREARKVFARRIHRSLEKADGIVTISDFSKKSIEERFNIEVNKVRAIHLGLEEEFTAPASLDRLEEAGEKFRLDPPFLLFVGALEPRKNLPTLVSALKIVHEHGVKIPLVIAGREGGDSKNLRERIRLSRLDDWVRLVGYLPGSELKSLYHLASAFVFPSSCEGFGLPLLEAMACELPIACSAASALPEVAQEAAVYFRPEEPEDIAEKILLVLKDENLRRELVAKGKKRVTAFNWRKTARETLSFYQTILGK